MLKRKLAVKSIHRGGSVHWSICIRLKRFVCCPVSRGNIRRVHDKRRQRYNSLDFVSAMEGYKLVGYGKRKGASRALPDGEVLAWVAAESSSVFESLFTSAVHVSRRILCLAAI